MAFGDFTTICKQNSMPLCALVGTGIIHLDSTSQTAGILAQCYARSIEVANTIIFQAATDVMHIAALGMTIIMILHVRSKFTAVGRKEITTFFYLYMLLTVVSLVLDAGVIAPGPGGIYPYFTAIQIGLSGALCTCLLINGFVGFQLYEDGTTLSVWLLRLASLGMFIVSFAVSLLTFKGWAGLGPLNTTGLFVVLYIVNGVQLAIYLAMQIILVVNTLQDRWPLAHIAFGVFFFVVGQVILYTLGQRICEDVQHYLDGLFFATMCNLLTVMMIYKYWDSITKEDLEFSVGTKQTNWDVKEPFISSTASYAHSQSQSTSTLPLDHHPLYHNHPHQPQRRSSVPAAAVTVATPSSHSSEPYPHHRPHHGANASQDRVNVNPDPDKPASQSQSHAPRRPSRRDSYGTQQYQHSQQQQRNQSSTRESVPKRHSVSSPNNTRHRSSGTGGAAERETNRQEREQIRERERERERGRGREPSSNRRDSYHNHSHNHSHNHKRHSQK